MCVCGGGRGESSILRDAKLQCRGGDAGGSGNGDRGDGGDGSVEPATSSGSRCVRRDDGGGDDSWGRRRSSGDDGEARGGGLEVWSGRQGGVVEWEEMGLRQRRGAGERDGGEPSGPERWGAATQGKAVDRVRRTPGNGLPNDDEFGPGSKLPWGVPSRGNFGDLWFPNEPEVISLSQTSAFRRPSLIICFEYNRCSLLTKADIYPTMLKHVEI